MAPVMPLLTRNTGDVVHRCAASRLPRSPHTAASRLCGHPDFLYLLRCAYGPDGSADIILAEPHQMRFIQRDHMVQQLPPYAPDPAFGDAVLPRAPNAGANSFYATGVQKPPHGTGELAVAVEHDEAAGTGSGKASRSCCTIHSLVG